MTDQSSALDDGRIEASHAEFQVGNTMLITKPTRVLKRECGNKSIQGLDVRGIGSDHVDEDNPMLIVGDAHVIEIGGVRANVRGMV